MSRNLTLARASRVAEAASVGIAGSHLLAPISLLIGGLLCATDKKQSKSLSSQSFLANDRCLPKPMKNICQALGHDMATAA